MGYRQCSEFASRVSVPLFFMISGYLFFGDAAPSRAISCVSAYVCFFIAHRTALHCAVYLHQYGVSAEKLLQKPVFYHLWFFFAIAVIYWFHR